MIRTSVYVVLVPERTWEGKVTAIKADRLLVQRPKLSNKEVAVQLHLDVDERLFEQFLPEVVVQITGERQLVIPEVEVQDQGQEAADVEELAAAMPDATDDAILEGLREAAGEGNQIAQAVLAGRRPWPENSGAAPRFEAWLARAQRAVAAAAPHAVRYVDPPSKSAKP
jgi:hypothetical protein